VNQKLLLHLAEVRHEVDHLGLELTHCEVLEARSDYIWDSG